MTTDELQQKTRELYEHLRRRISGCSFCETGHDPETHVEPVLPELNNIGQEFTWVCENGHRHYLDLLMAATSIRLEEREICILSTHLTPIYFIRVVPPEQTRIERDPDDSPTFTICACDGGSDHPWWEYVGPVEEKRDSIRGFMEAVVHAKNDPQVEVMPNLGVVHPAIIAGDYFSWGCEGADVLRRLQAKVLEDQAGQWEDRHFMMRVGEAVIRAAIDVREEPAQLILQIEGAQMNVSVDLMPPGGEVPHAENTAVIPLGCWEEMARHRVVQGQDAWERGGREEEPE